MRRPSAREREAAELRARQSLEARKGSPFTDEEWQEAKTSLIKFFGILAKWQVQADQQAADPPPAPATPPRRARAKKRNK